jgi:hypothetical protein
MKNKIVFYAGLYLLAGVVATIWLRRQAGEPKLFRVPRGREWGDLATWPLALFRGVIAKGLRGPTLKRDLTPVQPPSIDGGRGVIIADIPPPATFN